LFGCGSSWLVAQFPAPLGVRPWAAQNRTLMKAPTSWKPTLKYARLAGVLKSFT
jgi:hypothetical protein